MVPTDDPTPPELGVPTLNPEQIVACKYVAPTVGDTSDRRQYTLAYFWLTGFFCLTGSYVWLLATGANKETLGAMREMLTLITPATLMVLGYFYTASIGGRRKDEAIANMAAGAPK